MIILTDLAGWPSLLAVPPEQRQAPAPSALTAHLEHVNRSPARSVTATPALQADVTQALAELPPVVLALLRDHFLGVYYVAGAGSSAVTDIVVGPQGQFHGIAIALDVDAIGTRTANQWLSWRENMPFAPGPLHVSVVIADAAHDNRQNALQMLLLHEIGHVISAGRALVPDWWRAPADLGATADYEFLAQCWDIAADGAVRVRPQADFPGRDRLRYYGTPQLGQGDLVDMHRALLETSFFTLYGAQSPDEDFAESFALYVHTVLLHKPYFVRIHAGQRLLLQYASEWQQPRFGAKRAILERLLPAAPDWWRQPYAPLIGVAPLMRWAFRGEDMAPIATAFVERAQRTPDDANAFLDCSTALHLHGDREIALQLQAEAIRLQQHYRLPYGGADPALRLLVIMGPGDLMANTPVEFLLEDGDVAADLLYLTADAPWPHAFPAHDVMMVAIAEADASQPLLRRLAARLATWHGPVLNDPRRIAVLSRDGAWEVLDGTPGVAMPRTRRITRLQLQQLADQPAGLEALLPGAAWPLIVRPLGSHAGQELVRIDAAAALADYLAHSGAEQFYIAQFIDYRDADGRYGKYRVVLIDGVPYLCHYAVSEHWMVHYLNAGMDDSGEKRAREAACMAQFDTGFAVRHGAALAGIHCRLGMPYLGIDCAETADGRLLVFEVDNAMIVHGMDDPEVYPYKGPAMRKLFDAFRQLLAHCAA